MLNHEEFLTGVRDVFHSDISQFTETLTAGSGIIHLANVPWERWQPSFVSERAGRWNLQGQPTKYFADDLGVSLAELGYSATNPPFGRTVEVWQTKDQLPVISVGRFPKEIQSAIYQEKDSTKKWEYSHLLVEEFAKQSYARDYLGFFAPSASGIVVRMGGLCLAANPGLQSVERVMAMPYEEIIQLYQKIL